MNFDGEIKSISLEGFQVVKCKYFSRQSEPVMSLFPSAISFNTAAHNALHNCEYIEILLNEKKKCIAIIPASSSKDDSEAVRWQCGKDRPKYLRIECSAFTKPIFQAWKLNKDFHYKTMGKLVQCDQKVMLLFDFNEKEVWNGMSMVKEDG